MTDALAPVPVPEPTPVAPAQYIQLTPEALQAMIEDAVAKGARAAVSAFTAAGLPVPPPTKPTIYPLNDFIHLILAHLNTHNEHMDRSLHATADEHFPPTPEVSNAVA